MPVIAGTAFIKVDGKQYTLGGALSLKTNNVTREGVVGLSGAGGYTETPAIVYVEGDALTTAGFSAEELQNITNATITVELANGKTYVYEQAWHAGDISIDAAAGTCGLRFEALTCRELA